MASSSPSVRSALGVGVGERVPAEIAAVLPTAASIPDGPVRHEVRIGEERWRCVVRPVPVGPTVLLMRRLHEETDAVTALVDLGLTPRQSEVANALALTGGTNTQLARSLDMSEGTVKKHLEAVFRVLGVDSRAGAVVAVQALTGS